MEPAVVTGDTQKAESDAMFCKFSTQAKEMLSIARFAWHDQRNARCSKLCGFNVTSCPIKYTSFYSQSLFVYFIPQRCYYLQIGLSMEKPKALAYEQYAHES